MTQTGCHLLFELHLNTLKQPLCYNINKNKNNLLSIVANACVDLEDVVADEPDEVGEVGHGCLVDHELQHGLLQQTISTLNDD